MGNGLKKLEELLQENADYLLLASTLPVGKTLETLREELSGCADRLIGEISSSLEGRYFAIQKFLQTTPEGRQAVWLAVDSEPRRFPESCSELVAMNPAFGFDDAVAQRLRDAAYRQLDGRDAGADGAMPDRRVRRAAARTAPFQPHRLAEQRWPPTTPGAARRAISARR